MLIIVDSNMKEYTKKNVMKASEPKKKEVLFWRNKEVKNESSLGIPKSSADTSSSSNWAYCFGLGGVIEGKYLFPPFWVGYVIDLT